MSPTTDKKPAKAFIWIVLLAAAILIVLSWYAKAQTNAPLPSSTSETQATLGYGQIVLQLDNPSGFQQGQTVQVTSTTDQQTAVGTIVSWDPVLFNATINITTPNLQGNVYFSFFVQVLASAGNQVGIHPDLTAVSNTPYNGASSGAVPGTPSTLKMTVSLPGSLVGGSTGNPGTSPTLTAGNVYPFTVPAGLFYPVQGNVQLDDLSPGIHNHYNASVFSYMGTTLNLLITAVFSTGSPSSTWGVYGVAGPANVLPLGQMTGLQVTQVSTGSVLNITAGAIADSTGAINLAITTNTTLDLAVASNTVKVLQNGTISSTGATVTGVGTNFLSNFSASATLTAWTNILTGLNLLSNAAWITSARSLISTASATASTASVSSNTALTSSGQNLGASGSPFFRGGPVNSNSSGVHYGIILAYNNATGAVGAFASSFTPSGVADVPPGYSYYNVIAIASVTSSGGGSYIINIQQIANSVTMFLSPVKGISGTQFLLGSGNGALGQAAYPLSPGDLSLPTASNILSGDVNLNNVSNYFDGPSMAQGTQGTWFASGSVVVSDTAGVASVNCKLWDGTTVISSGRTRVELASTSIALSLSGYLASPAGNIRISCQDVTSVSGKIQFNASGNSADSSIWGIRIQ